MQNRYTTSFSEGAPRKRYVQDKNIPTKTQTPTKGAHPQPLHSRSGVGEWSARRPRRWYAVEQREHKRVQSPHCSHSSSAAALSQCAQCSGYLRTWDAVGASRRAGGLQDRKRGEKLKGEPHDSAALGRRITFLSGTSIHRRTAGLSQSCQSVSKWTDQARVPLHIRRTKQTHTHIYILLIYIYEREINISIPLRRVYLQRRMMDTPWCPGVDCSRSGPPVPGPKTSAEPQSLAGQCDGAHAKPASLSGSSPEIVDGN